MSTPLVCSNCAAPLPAAVLNTGDFRFCPRCQARLHVRVFPALLRPVSAGQAGEIITEEGQAACFYHPHKAAHVPCDACGRFICALCDVELHGQHLCPSCVETGRRKGSLTTLESRRVLWDNISLLVTVLPVVTFFLWFLAFISAPTGIIIAIIGWRKPRSLVPRWTKLRFLATFVLALAIMAGFGGLAYFVVHEGRMR